MRYCRRFCLLTILTLLLSSLPFATAIAVPDGNFQQIPTPNPGTTGNSLSDVAALSNGTSWAIGSRSGPTTLPMILFYDGLSWTEKPVPAEAEGIAFSSVVSTPEGDVWLAGTRAYTVYDRELFFMRARDGAIDRVDHVFNPGAPIDMSAISSSDIWALTPAGFVIHFDGSEWTESDVPIPFLTLNYPKAIHAAGPDDVWIVGYGGDQRGDYSGYVQHWDGSSWTSVPTPFDGQQPIFFRDIDGSAADDIWIVGYINYSQHLSMHWDGTAWTQVAGPASDAPLMQVAALASDDVWAAPYSLTGGRTFYHWDGSSWSDVAGPELPGATTIAWRGLAKVGAGDLWAAGSYYIEPGHQTLVARLLPAAAPVGGKDLRDVFLTVFPSPFNPLTTFSFELPAEGAVSLDVYDLTGRRVARLVEGVLSAGSHSVPWNAARLPSGVYLYRLAANGVSRSGRVTLLK